jgi:hypothetical protein
MNVEKGMATIGIMGGCLVDRTCKHVYGTKILLRESWSWVGNIICTLFFWLLDFRSDSYKCGRDGYPLSIHDEKVSSAF